MPHAQSDAVKAAHPELAKFAAPSFLKDLTFFFYENESVNIVSCVYKTNWWSHQSHRDSPVRQVHSLWLTVFIPHTTILKLKGQITKQHTGLKRAVATFDLNLSYKHV